MTERKTAVRALDLALASWGALVSAVMLTSALPDRALVYVASLTKLAALAAGAALSVRAARRFDRGSSSASAWWCFAVWLGSWAAAQSCLGYYQWALGIDTPFPSIADPLFVVGYFALVPGLVLLLLAYLRSGLPVGTPASLVVIAGVVAAGATVPGVAVMRPVVAAGGPWLELALNLAYPALDLVALVPAVVLLRITLRFRGGSVFWIFALLGSGFVAMAVGDILYAYLSILGSHGLEPLIDAAYVIAYLLVARGAWQQVRVST